MHERLRAVARDPLFHFLLLGMLAFVLYSVLTPGTIETIVVDPADMRGLEARRSEILGRPLTEEERAEIRREWVEDEILIREAYRRGLERQDSRVRNRLLILMRSSLDETLPDPDREQLETHFKENIDRYWDRESITFTHVLFPHGSEATPEDNAAFLSTLARGEFTPPADPRAGILETRTATVPEIRSAMGPEASRLMLAIDGASWEGPIESPLGAHFVKILERRPVPQPTFDAMLAYVRGDWELEQRAQIRSRKIAEIEKNYRIVVAED